MQTELMRYETLLDALEKGSAEGLEAIVLEVLGVRDTIARAATDTAALTTKSLATLHNLDARLRAKAAHIAVVISRPALKSWRTALAPPVTSWWWSLDVVADESIPAPHPLWAIISAAFITLAISLATDISLRFLSGGADLLGLIGTFSQAFLALLAGSAFTRVGGGWIDRLLARRKVNPSSYGAVKTMFALAVLAIIVALRLSLSAFAREYNDYGMGHQRAGNITRARLAFERAVRLDPDAPGPHYNLASAHEETLDYDAALGEYQRAIKLDERIYPAYNNLARLYMLRRNDFASALQLLDEAMLIAPEDKFVRYSMLKNRGWANFGLKYYLQAEADLNSAIQLRADGAAAHCLLAQAYEAQKKEALAEWQACVANAEGQRDEVESSWLGQAQERLLAVP